MKKEIKPKFNHNIIYSVNMNQNILVQIRKDSSNRDYILFAIRGRNEHSPVIYQFYDQNPCRVIKSHKDKLVKWEHPERKDSRAIYEGLLDLEKTLNTKYPELCAQTHSGNPAYIEFNNGSVIGQLSGEGASSFNVSLVLEDDSETFLSISAYNGPKFEVREKQSIRK